MTDEDSDAESPFAEYTTVLEARLELPTGFLESIEYQDEWSFVIKAHAFLEAVISHALSSLSDPRLTTTFGSMQLGGGRTGKLAFARALELLDQQQLRFAIRMSELRNTLVHDVRQVDFAFPEYFASLDSAKFRSVATDLTCAFDDAAEDIAAGDFALLRAYPRTVIYFTLLSVVSDLFYRIHPEDRPPPEGDVSLGLLFVSSVAALDDIERMKTDPRFWR